MTALELKIPPVMVAAITAVLMWVTYILTPETPIPAIFRKITMYSFTAAGAVIGFAGVVSFRKAETTVNPLKPDECTSLVSSGIYRFTRNPMYLALLLALLGWGLILSDLYSLAWSAVFVLYINRFQIQPEERALEKRFGAEFTRYQSRVRRWI